MTQTKPKRPNDGGSYRRLADGSYQRIPDPQPDPAPAAPATPAAPAVDFTTED